ncbi:DUF7446 family protein [Lactococcus lactis]|uniref:DUF7446 family protein n=1 Tax=Lactococcus lactis TaxID=1358 RepID=UPI0021A80486|nr:hypothetical protein [Lactococcus lactis]MCT0052076.1 hypothetical protein [Lactococcus lactis subsp. lactis]
MSEVYKNMVIANAAISNDIYLTTINKDGMMSLKRKVITEDVLRAAVQNMQKDTERNGRAIYSWSAGNKIVTLAFIPDELRVQFLKWCDEVGYSRTAVPVEDGE